MKFDDTKSKAATPFFRKPVEKIVDSDSDLNAEPVEVNSVEVESAPEVPEVPEVKQPEPVKVVVDVKLPKVLSPILKDEPTLTFRAKDNFSDFPIKAYLQVLRSAKYADDSPEILSLQEWLARREAWRAANPDKCKRPDY